MTGFASFFVEGGFWMVPIAFVSMLALAVAIDRIYFLFFVHRAPAAELWANILAALRRQRPDQAMQACDEYGASALARVLRRGIEGISHGVLGVQIGLEEASLEVMPELQKRSTTLAGLASLATLLGLLGTVMGLIDAFRVVADAPMDQKAVLLTRAIAVAMNTTAFGLMVAIPALLIQLGVNGTSKALMDDVDAYSAKLENFAASQSNLKSN